MNRIFTLIFLIAMLSSCGSSKKVTTRKSQNKTSRVVKTTKKNKVPEVVVNTSTETEEISKETPENYATPTHEYIAIYSDIAQDEMRNYGIPASITLAQGILESGSGKGRLSVEANNHFGIKCHTGWTGGKIYHDDDEDQECFRK